MGYGGESSELLEGPFQGFFLNKRIEYALIREEQGFHYLLELHWGLFLGVSSEREAIKALWAEACPKSVFGVMAFESSAEWTFLFLAVHAARHRWRGLKWLSDIHELCTRRAIDWAKLRFEAERIGWEEAVELTLNACHTLFGTTIPPHFSMRTLPPWVHLFPADLLHTEPWQHVLMMAGLCKSPIARWRYLMHMLLVPTEADRHFIRLPLALDMFYFPLHLLRVTSKYGRRLAAHHLRKLRSLMVSAP
jgi:hypothetical protein